MAQYRFTFSEEFLIEANLRYRRQLPWRRPFYGLKGVLAFILLALGAFVAIAAKWWLLVPFAAFAGALFLGWPLDAWFLRRRFRKSPYYNDEITLTISDEGIHGTGRSSETRLNWSLITKARRFADGLLLFQGPQVFHWLPNAAAVAPADVADLERLVRARVQDTRDV
jgi:hypothetical protein